LIKKVLAVKTPDHLLFVNVCDFPLYEIQLMTSIDAHQAVPGPLQKLARDSPMAAYGCPGGLCDWRVQPDTFSLPPCDNATDVHKDVAKRCCSP
jgi:hypothetical protein